MWNSEGTLKEIRKAVKGKEDCIVKVMAAILANGHILIEDVPGVGKTTLAIAFSKAMNLKNNRIQFTPDVMPADILGFSMYNKESANFSYHEGVVMCNLLLADEINRTSPKTQSALLEVMEEGNVTVDGITHKVPEPFIVIATQNPKGSSGTQFLPESQLDRFIISISMGYPDELAEMEIAKGKSVRNEIEEIEAVMDGEKLLQLQEEVEKVHVNDNVYKYIVSLINATRNHRYIDLGVSPRGTIALTKMAKAHAFLKGRDHVLPEDVQNVFIDVAKHRVVLNTNARVSHVAVESILKEIIEEVKPPMSFGLR